ncbi:S66 family peptidase [Bacillus niameyensis]|uniref:S66 family peptidase n=1 Tax=Bacillus niameyensis TaxID=1522308 RepID=UPI000782BF4F|nr:S66 peptidase family protein [Bacillus niameyensis]
MIHYPYLRKDATIGVTAPSSGVKGERQSFLYFACNSLKASGFNIAVGDTVWTQHKAKSAPAQIRAMEFNEMIRNNSIDIIIPPWGGELLIEILEFIDFENIPNKWILGYSDVSVLLLAITLKTGMGTAHGTNLTSLRGEHSDETTAMWQSVLSTKVGHSVTQFSSKKFQKEWGNDKPSTSAFHLTEPTSWKTMSEESEKIEGRLLGGCIDVIRHLIGTPYGDVENFRKNFIKDEPILWYLENCELTTTDLRRSLIQMKLAGWFRNSSGIMFGRSSANHPIDHYTAEDVYKELAEELNIPIIYDIDCGHVPPQITFINGAFAEVEVNDGSGKVIQHFRP